MIPIKTVIGVTITSIMAGNVNSIAISENIQGYAGYIILSDIFYSFYHDHILKESLYM